MSNLKSGFTTGTHASAAIVGVVYEYLYDRELRYVTVTLPRQKKATVEIYKVASNEYGSIKSDNDDIDVTKGAHIRAALFTKRPRALQVQNPVSIRLQNATVSLYAGEGVGIVTKKGLKIAPSYPAINPTPLAMIRQNLYALPLVDDVHIVLSVVDGETLARQTANEKVGVIGGISILGTTGIVKPISSDAYVQTIQTHMHVARNYCDSVILTLGNSAYEAARERYNDDCIVEIGNFVYDAIQIARRYGIKKIVFLSAIAKMAKIAQGSKNTHNRYGGLDMNRLKQCLQTYCGITLRGEFPTLKAMMETLASKQKECIEHAIALQAQKRLFSWSRNSIECETHIVKVRR